MLRVTEVLCISEVYKNTLFSESLCESVFSECVYPCRVSMVCVCWLARKVKALDCSEDNVVVTVTSLNLTVSMKNKMTVLVTPVM